MTPSIDYDELRKLAEQLAVIRAVAEFPDRGGIAIRAVMRAAILAFTAVDSTQLEGPVCIFCRTLPYSLDNAPIPTLGRIEELRTYVKTGYCVEVDASGSFKVWGENSPLPYGELSEFAVVFVHDAGNEEFWINNNPIRLAKVFPGKQSFFARPTYNSLDECLAYFKFPIARYSRCEILENIWHDSNKLFLKAKPEATIRRSLTNYLRHALGADAEVMPEQNVNETEPVDIRVTFQFAGRVALIEIKWLGKSIGVAGTITTEYTAYQARLGAQQLADYLDEFARSSPDRIRFGYLVVFDARRYGLSGDSTEVTTENGFHFEHEEIKYSPEFHLKRTDFKEPVRMFAEPICTTQDVESSGKQ